MIDDIKKLAERQFDELMETGESSPDHIGFEFEGQFIVNPWYDPSGRFELTTDEAIDLYGKDFLQFCERVIDER